MTQIATQSQDSFTQWGKEYVLPCLNKEVEEQEAQKIAMLVFKFSKQSDQKITESDLRNLLGHGSPQHEQMTKIVTELRRINDEFEPKHCETINAWVRKNILKILFKDGFNADTAKIICKKLDRKKIEKKWLIHPNDFILIINDDDIAEAQKKVIIDKKEISRRISLVTKYFND
ncbi:MAG: hypothetical protein KBB86_03270 [Candidatus Pacebacteria bacterium]|nr:hypothetical protein [Candidatus Paceibacterota bacterium]